jgi:hypothetical protein
MLCMLQYVHMYACICVCKAIELLCCTNIFQIDFMCVYACVCSCEYLHMAVHVFVYDVCR